jgi:uncharacterized protein (DUF58 family)
MKIRWFPITILIIIVALSLAGGFTLLWRLFIFLVFLLLLSYLWLRLSIRHIDGNVAKSPENCQVGERVEEEFAFLNHSRIPTPLIEVREDTDLPGYRNVATFNLAPQGSHNWRTEIRCQRRGRYSLGTLTAKATDPLGFFSMERHFGKSQGIVVFPATLDLPLFQTLPRQEPGASPRHWLASQVGPNASRVREYTSGDSLRHIHWHSTAHTGNLMVKEFDPDRYNYTFKDIWIALDMYQGCQLGVGDETIEEYSITITASLAKKYLESGKNVGLIASGERAYLFLPETGDEHLKDILHALAIIKATGKLPIDNLLASQAERFEAGSALVVITSSDCGGIVAPLRRTVNRGIIVTVILLDAMSFGGETSTIDTARRLVASGINAYTVRRGVEINRALDSRFLSLPIPYTGDKDNNG